MRIPGCQRRTSKGGPVVYLGRSSADCSLRHGEGRLALLQVADIQAEPHARLEHSGAGPRKMQLLLIIDGPHSLSPQQGRLQPRICGGGAQLPVRALPVCRSRC